MARKQSHAIQGRDEEASTPQRLRVTSGAVGVILLAFAGIWLAWLLLHQFAGSAVPAPPTIHVAPTINSPELQITPLVAAGITLSHPDKTPGLSQQQALLIASQLEPDAASKAKTAIAQYVLLNYPDKGTPATHTDFHNVPTWMVLYQGIPLKPANASVDQAPPPHSSYDLYVFLDASSGKELLAVQV